jgi:lipoyl(octanoyl) transferase
MATDEALMDRARQTGEWVLRVYTWSTPTVSVGRNQTARGHYDPSRIRERGLAVVRRPTGGRAILHHREITYSVTAPAEQAGDLRQSYERINALLTTALHSIGVHAEIAQPGTRATAPGVTPCFDQPSAGELTLGGRKLAGSAQWRCDGALLQHGSILIEDDQSALRDLVVGEQPPIPAPATLAEALGRRPEVDEVSHALGDAVRQLEDPGAESLEIDAELRARRDALVVRYLDDGWTWRR